MKAVYRFVVYTMAQQMMLHALCLTGKTGKEEGRS